MMLKIKIKEIGQWQLITNGKFLRIGGSKLLERYDGNFLNLLQNIYPNYPFQSRKKRENTLNIFYHFQSIENQRAFFDDLFIKLKLKTLNDWYKIHLSTIISHGGKSTLKNYEYDIGILMNIIYPNFPWSISEFKINLLFHFKKIKNQREFMDRLFIKFQLKSIEEWINKKWLIKLKSGKKLLKKIYLNNYEKLLQRIYPNFPWNLFYFKIKIKSKDFFNSIENQRSFLDHLYQKYNVGSLDDWSKIIIRKINKFGAYQLLTYYNNRNELLKNIYPNFPWDFEKKKKKKEKKTTIKSLYEQRSIMSDIYIKLKLKSMEEWRNISVNRMNENGGKKLMKLYKNDLHLLLLSIYPEYDWNFEKTLHQTKYMKLHFQQSFFDHLYKKLELKSFDDWAKLSSYKIIKNGGKKIINYYKRNLSLALTIIYPNFPWSLTFINYSQRYFKSKENQRLFMDLLYQKLELKSIDDWSNIALSTFVRNRGVALIKLYNFDLKLLLSSIYPEHPWKFQSNFSEISNFKIHSILLRLNKLREEYQIREKKDWYRLPTEIDQLHLLETLNLIYPNESWDKNFIFVRSKKSIQRLLFAQLSKIYSSYLIFENYDHPLIYSSSDLLLEYDLFIPSLNMAMEYQGEQHFDDLPMAYAAVETIQFRDRLKEDFSQRLSINLIYIPYWWDRSPPSLIQTIYQSQKQNHLSLPQL